LTRRPWEAISGRTGRRPCERSGSDHDQVGGGERGGVQQGGELDHKAGAVAVGVEIEGAGGFVVDDAVVRIERGAAGDEGAGIERARIPDPLRNTRGSPRRKLQISLAAMERTRRGA
jgi:hypothetical protein